jgi:hypothetical protein
VSTSPVGRCAASPDGAVRSVGAVGTLLVVVLALASVLLQTGWPSPAAAGLTPVQSVEGVTGSPTALTLTATPGAVARGGATTLAGRLTDPSTGAGVADAVVAVEVLGADGAWTVAGTATTDAAGSVSVAQVLDAESTFRMHFGEPGAAEESLSLPTTVAVQALTAGSSARAVRIGRPVVVSGVLAAGEGRTLRVERQVGGQWQVLARTATDAAGAYATTVTPTTAGSWRLRVVRGPAGRPSASAGLPPVDVYRLHTYSVRTRGVVTADLGVFRATVAETYADPRGWLGAHHRFRPAGPGRAADFTVVLSEARHLPAYSSTCSTAYSCRVGRFVIINQTRWRFGSRHFPGTLDEYRDMVVNHETGHWLGFGHAYCSSPGARAPVMQQQSKGMHGCRVNPWPLPREIRAAS